MKMLITGGLGLVGSEAVKFFSEKDWEVVSIDNNMRSYFFGVDERAGKYNFNIDIRSESEIERIFKAHKFDAIIHSAAQPSHDWAKKEPLTDFDVNARGTLILLEATRKWCPGAVFVHVSTDKVYGERMECALEEMGTRYSPMNHKFFTGFHESLGLDFAGNRSLFGCSKTAADLYVQEYGNYFGMKTACFRCGCITGRNHQGAELHGFLAYLSKCFREDGFYEIHGNGKQVRDIIHVYDLVNAFWHFIQDPDTGAVYNMGGGPERSISVLEAITMFEGAFGKKIALGTGPERKGDRRWDVHDVSQFRNDFPRWDYKYSLADIINDLVFSMKTVDIVLEETMSEFTKHFSEVTIDYSSLMDKAEKAGGGVDILTVPKFLQRAVIMAYQAGQEAKAE